MKAQSLRDAYLDVELHEEQEGFRDVAQKGAHRGAEEQGR